MSLSNSLKSTPLQSTGGTILPGAEFGNPLAKIPAAEASSNAASITPTVPTTVLPLTDEEKAALRYQSMGMSLTKYLGAYGRAPGSFGPISGSPGLWWGGV